MWESLKLLHTAIWEGLKEEKKIFLSFCNGTSVQTTVDIAQKFRFQNKHKLL